MSYELLRTVINGKDVSLGVWRHGGDGRFGDLRKIAKAAQLAAEGYSLQQQRIRADTMRSDLAKSQDTKEQALDRLRDLGKAQKQLNEARKGIQEEAAALMRVAPYRDGDHATVAIDLALAAHMRTMPAGKLSIALSTGSDPRLVEAATRLPLALTGLSPAMYATMTRAAVERDHPREAATLEALQESLDDAQVVLQKTFQHIAGTQMLTWDEKLDVAGDDPISLLKVAEGSGLDTYAERRMREQADEGEEATDSDTASFDATMRAVHQRRQDRQPKPAPEQQENAA